MSGLRRQGELEAIDRILVDVAKDEGKHPSALPSLDARLRANVESYWRRVREVITERFGAPTATAYLGKLQVLPGGITNLGPDGRPPR